MEAGNRRDRMTYEIRVLSFGEILDTAFRLLRDQFVVLVAIAACIYVPIGLAQAVLLGMEPGTGLGATYWISLAVILLMALAAPLAQLAVTYVVSETYLGRKLGIAEAYAKGASVYLPYLGTALLLVLGVLAGLVLLVIPGIYLSVIWLLVGPVIVIEGVSGPRALGRSRDLMRDNWWRGAFIVFLASLLASVVSGGFDLVFAFIPVVGPVLSGLVQAIFFAFGAAVVVLLYFDLRCRHEDFDLQHLAEQIGKGTEPGPPVAAR